jgi:ribosomal protein L29
MKMSDVKKLKDEELSVEAARIRRSLFDLRAQVVTEKVKDTSQFSKLRTDLARVLTESSARRNASASSGKKVHA